MTLDLRAPLRRSFWQGVLQRGVSIRGVLIMITAALTLMIALLSARELMANAERLEQTYRLRTAMEVSDLLSDATAKISVERDLGLAVLQASDAETTASLLPTLAESRAAADAAVAAVAALDDGALGELAPLRQRLIERFALVRAMRARLDAAQIVPRSRREAGLALAWESETTGLMTDIQQLWASFIRPYTRIDATVTQHLRYRHMLRTITDYTGRERSIIGQLLSENVAPTPAQTADLLRAEGVLQLSWATSRLLAEQSGLYAEVDAAYTDAESHYATLADMTRGLFYVPGMRHVSYPIAPDIWFELSSQSAESLALLREASRDATQRHLAGMIATTERAIAMQGSLALIAVLLCVASFWVILVRVTGPIGRIVDALTRATRGEPVVFAQGQSRTDEIAKLTDVLAAFQDNAEQSRRTASELRESTQALATEVAVRREAEAKAQAQLERLALLHQISRAIGERQDLGSIFQVAVGSVEQHLPADFACIFVHDHAADALRVASVGARSFPLAQRMNIVEDARVEIDANGLSRCLSGRLVYEPDLVGHDFPFPQRLLSAGLHSFVAAPLQVESHVFGAFVVARLADNAFGSAECEFLRQLSEHVALAAHQAELNAALQQAYDELRQTQEAVTQQERLRALGQMASGIAHDINNALSPIALYTESLLNTEPQLSDAGRNKLEIVQRAIDDAGRTIARMNEFYRKRDHQLTLASVDANTLVRQVLDLTQARWRDMPQQRGDVIEVKTDLSSSLPAIMGVESEVREALTNLVFNAIDALPSGGTVTLRTRTAGADFVLIEVEDNGVGMDEATRQRCLEPFFTTKGERGTGLGLAMVYGAMQRHGGALEIESAPGKGTIIRLKFAVGAKGVGAPVLESVGPRRRLSVLVVDDDPVLLRALRDVLEQDGHVVTATHDGEAAIAAFGAALASTRPFDAVITDLGMPGLDGRRVASAIKQRSSATPVILLTGWGERLRAEEEALPDIDHVLSKPPRLGEVRAALAQLCGPPARETSVVRMREPS